MRYILLLLAFLLLPLSSGQAQMLPAPSDKPAETTQTAPAPEIPADPLGRRSPRGAVQGYIAAMGAEDYTRAAQYFDTSELGRTEKKHLPEMIKIFQEMLDDNGALKPTALLSDQPQGASDDNLPEDQEQVGFFSPGGQKTPIFLEKEKDEDGNPTWLFSAATVKLIPAEYTKANAYAINNFLPPMLVDNKWGGVPCGHWLAMVALVIICYLAAWALVGALVFLLGRIWRKNNAERINAVIKAFALPVRLYATVRLLVYTAHLIGISVIVRQYFSKANIIVAGVALLILLWRLIDVFASLAQRHMMRNGQLGALSTVMFFRRSMKFIVIALGAITVLDTLGFNVTAGLTALGIGGIALALGAQKTVENLVGSLTVIFDQPVRVGDYCKVGDISGTIEQIGMRSTRIRTLDRTLVTIPNGDFAGQKIENYAHRDRFKFQTELGVRYETSPDQIRYLLVELRKILFAHSRVARDPSRVRFLGFGADSLRIEIFAYILSSDYNEFLEIQEDLNLRIADVLDASGTSLAFTSQTLYLARDSGLSKEKKSAAEAEVAEWRRKMGERMLRLDEEYIRTIENTITYPPKA